MLEKSTLGRSLIMLTGRTRYSKNRNIVVLSYINFNLTSIKEKPLHRQVSTYKNTCYK